MIEWRPYPFGFRRAYFFVGVHSLVLDLVEMKACRLFTVDQFGNGQKYLIPSVRIVSWGEET